MAETLGTKDVLEQVDARLGNVEQDIRELRSEMNSRFDWVYQKIGGLRAEMSHCSAVRLPLGTNNPFTSTDRHFKRACVVAVLILLNEVGLLLFK